MLVICNIIAADVKRRLPPKGLWYIPRYYKCYILCPTIYYRWRRGFVQHLYGGTEASVGWCVEYAQQNSECDWVLISGLLCVATRLDVASAVYRLYVVQIILYCMQRFSCCSIRAIIAFVNSYQEHVLRICIRGACLLANSSVLLQWVLPRNGRGATSTTFAGTSLL